MKKNKQETSTLKILIIIFASLLGVATLIFGTCFMMFGL